MYDKRFLAPISPQAYPAAQVPLPTETSGMPPNRGARVDDAPDPLYCVFVIDTSPTVRHIVRVLLERKHMIVFDFADSNQALQWLEEGTCKPHIILLDIDVPIERWFLISHYVRSKTAYASTVIIALSRKEGLPEHVQEVRTAIRWYITKPFSPQELLYVVQSSLPGIMYR